MEAKIEHPRSGPPHVAVLAAASVGARAAKSRLTSEMGRKEQEVRIAVLGLWHLGCVTAACLAEAGHSVVGLDPDPNLVEGLRQGRPPLHEPGLADLMAAGQTAGNLLFTSDPR